MQKATTQANQNHFFFHSTANDRDAQGNLSLFSIVVVTCGNKNSNRNYNFTRRWWSIQHIRKNAHRTWTNNKQKKTMSTQSTTIAAVVPCCLCVWHIRQSVSFFSSSFFLKCSSAFRRTLLIFFLPFSLLQRPNNPKKKTKRISHEIAYIAETNS